jgi:hypothetical protein
MAAPTPFLRPPPGSPEQGSTRNSSPVAPAPLGRLGPRHQRRRPPQKRKEEVGKKWSVPLPYSFLVTARLSRPLRAPRIGLLSYLGHRGAQPQAVLSVPVGDALVPSKRNGLAFCRRGPRHQRRRPPQKRKEEVGKKWVCPFTVLFSSDRTTLAPPQGASNRVAQLPGASRRSAPGCPLGPRWGRAGSVEAKWSGLLSSPSVVGGWRRGGFDAFPREAGSDRRDACAPVAHSGKRSVRLSLTRLGTCGMPGFPGAPRDGWMRIGIELQ